MASGFDNIHTFYRNFKKVYGVTTTQYIRNYQSGLGQETAMISYDEINEYIET